MGARRPGGSLFFVLFGLAPARAAEPLPRSAVEARLLADLDQRLAEPNAGLAAQVSADAASFYEGRLFPYVLPTLALGAAER